MMSERRPSWQDGADEDPLRYVDLGLEERAELAAERTGVPLEEVLEQFRELDRRFSFDDPEQRRIAEVVVDFYELDPWPRPRDEETVARIAGELGVTPAVARERIEEVERLTGRSMEVPIERAMANMAMTLYEAHGDHLPPPGDPWWSQGSDG